MDDSGCTLNKILTSRGRNSPSCSLPNCLLAHMVAILDPYPWPPETILLLKVTIVLQFLYENMHVDICCKAKIVTV